MNPIGQPERATQNRVITLFRDELGYRYLGDWSDRDGNTNIEKKLLAAYLKKRGYTRVQINAAVHRLRTEADDSRFKLDKCLIKMCRRDRLLELMHDFILFDGGVKKLPRAHQYFGIKAAQKHVKKRRGGIIWHTQGSGKSIVMVLLAKWILENNPNARVAVITDRDRSTRIVLTRRVGTTSSKDSLISDTIPSTHLAWSPNLGRMSTSSSSRRISGEMKLAITPCDASRRICRACPPKRMPDIRILVSQTIFTMMSVCAYGDSGFLLSHLVRLAYCDSTPNRQGRKRDPIASAYEHKSEPLHAATPSVCETLALPLRQFRLIGCLERICLR